MKKRIISLTLISAMALSNIGSIFANEIDPADIKINHPYLNGYEDESFNPKGNVTRSEIAKMITIIRELEKSVANFPDVGNEHSWASEFIGAAQKSGILVGDDIGTFRPQAGLTRAELATIVSRVVALDNEARTKVDGANFSDIDGHWGKDAIGNISNLGIIDGYEDGTFRPDEYISRQEAAKMLNRMMKRIPDPKIYEKLENPYTDITDEWGRDEILGAGTDYRYIIEDNGVDLIIVDGNGSGSGNGNGNGNGSGNEGEVPANSLTVTSLEKINGILVGLNADSYAVVRITDSNGKPVTSLPESVTLTYPTSVDQSEESSVVAGETVSFNSRLQGTIDENGVVSVNLGRATTESQEGTLIVKDENGKIIGEIAVRSESSAIASQKLTISDGSKVKPEDNNTIYIENPDKDSITYAIKGYNSYGTFVGFINLNGYNLNLGSKLKIEEDILDANGNIIIDSYTFTLSATGPISESSLVVSDLSGVEVGNETIVVEGSSNVIEEDALTGIEWINRNSFLWSESPGNVVDGKSSLQLSSDGGDSLITGLSVTGSFVDYPQRVKEVASETVGERLLAIYLDKDNDGLQSETDEVIGFISFSLNDETFGINLGANGFDIEVTEYEPTGTAVFNLKGVDELGNPSNSIAENRILFVKDMEPQISFMQSQTEMATLYIENYLFSTANSMINFIDYATSSGFTINGTDFSPSRAEFKYSLTIAPFDTGSIIEPDVARLKELASMLDNTEMVAYYDGLDDRIDTYYEKLHSLNQLIYDMAVVSAITMEEFGGDGYTITDASGIVSIDDGGYGVGDSISLLDITTLGNKYISALPAESKASIEWFMDEYPSDFITIDGLKAIVANNEFNYNISLPITARVSYIGANGENISYYIPTEKHVLIHGSVVANYLSKIVATPELVAQGSTSISGNTLLDGISINGVSSGKTLNDLIAELGTITSITTTVPSVNSVSWNGQDQTLQLSVSVPDGQAISGKGKITFVGSNGTVNTNLDLLP